MLTQTLTICFRGIEAVPITIETQVSGGSLPSFSIVGLPDKAISESKERMRGALFTLGLALPSKRIIMNLSPANIQKEGSHYDLPMMLGLLLALDILPKEVQEYVSLGELGLDASIKTVQGALVAALFASSVRKGLICPAACGSEAIWGGNKEVLAAASVLEIINHFRGVQVLSEPIKSMEDMQASSADFSDIKGQETAKRALLIAAAGGHNVLMIGPPGTGKSMMAERMRGILPPLNPEESLQISMIHSMMTGAQVRHLIRQRPFRSPHHSASMASMIGGGVRSCPGEVSLAHAGILFLDELAEFQRPCLEALRQPLESGYAVITRANYRIHYPAKCQLIAAMNPCRCGYLGNVKKQCSKAPTCGEAYRRHLSGPLLDRIDIFIDVPDVSLSSLSYQEKGVCSAALRTHVQKARFMQEERQQEFGMNAYASPDFLDTQVTESVQSLLLRAVDKFHLSVRSYYRLIRVARTIADLESCTHIKKEHMAEAISYRPIIFSEKIL